jgi:hypothetical protein
MHYSRWIQRGVYRKEPIHCNGNRRCYCRWCRWRARQRSPTRTGEESGDYTVQASLLFAHERLEAYQSSLLVVVWFHAVPGGAELSRRWFRQIDKAVTSVVLNIAEG